MTFDDIGQVTESLAIVAQFVDRDLATLTDDEHDELSLAVTTVALNTLRAWIEDRRTNPRQRPGPGAQRPSADYDHRDRSPTVDHLRVVALVPATADAARWLNVLGEYAVAHGYTIATVTGDLLTAMTEIVQGRADRILARSDWELRPLIDTLAGKPNEVPTSQRRPRRLR
jgi:hypothetical protein